MANSSRPSLSRAALFGLLLTGAAIATPPQAAAQALAPYSDARICTQGSDFTVENQSDQPILQLYVRVTGAPEWGGDRLGDRELGKGQQLQLDIGPQIVDVLALRADGRAFLTRNQHSCRLARIRIEADRAVSIP